MKKFVSLLLILLAVAAIVGVLSWLENTKPEPVAELKKIPPIRVMSTEVIQGDVQTTHRLTGRLIPSMRSALHFEISGLVLEKSIEAGQSVAEGQVLLRLDSQDQRDRLAEAKLVLQQQQEARQRDQELLQLVTQQRQLLDRELARQESLTERALLAQSKMDESRRALISARLEESRLKHSVRTSQTALDRAELDVRKAERDLARTELKAPYAATVNAVKAELGEYVTSGQVVIDLVNIQELDLQLDVAGRVLSALQTDQPLTVTESETGQPVSGHLVAMQPDPDPQTHTHAIRVRVPGDQLTAGQLAQVTLGEGVIQNAFQVPVSAVLQENDLAYVFLIENDQVARHAIEVIGREGGFLVVRDIPQNRNTPNLSSRSLMAGQLIVSQDVAALIDGQSISLKQEVMVESEQETNLITP